jgi:hypothetical protein
MSEADLDTRVRTQAFQFLTEQTRFHGEVVPRNILERGFDFEGRRVPLIGPQGIFKAGVDRGVGWQAGGWQVAGSRAGRFRVIPGPTAVVRTALNYTSSRG